MKAMLKSWSREHMVRGFSKCIDLISIANVVTSQRKFRNDTRVRAHPKLIDVPLY